MCFMINMNSDELLREYRHHNIKATMAEIELEKRIDNFFMENAPDYFVTHFMNDSGKYIVLEYYAPFVDGGYDCLSDEVLRKFCEEFKVTCESVSKKCNYIDPLNENYKSQSNEFTTLFEIIKSV